MSAFSEAVPFLVGSSVRLCWRVLVRACCKAVRAGAGRRSGFSVRLCCGSREEISSNACPLLEWAFCEAVMAGSYVGFM